MQLFFEISRIKKFAIFTGKHLCSDLFLIKLQAFRPVTILKRNSNTGVSCGYCELFKNSFFSENFGWLLLTVLPQYSEASWGISYLILRLHVLANLIKILRKTQHKYFFTITWQNSFFLAWINLLRAFYFRICFGETLVAFDFEEKFTQNVAQITILYLESKDFLHMHFVLDQTWKWKNTVMKKYWIKNMAVKIPNSNLAFIYLANFLLLLL